MWHSSGWSQSSSRAPNYMEKSMEWGGPGASHQNEEMMTWDRIVTANRSEGYSLGAGPRLNSESLEAPGRRGENLSSAHLPKEGGEISVLLPDDFIAFFRILTVHFIRQTEFPLALLLFLDFFFIPTPISLMPGTVSHLASACPVPCLPLQCHLPLSFSD